MVNQTTLIQQLVPAHALGRVSASQRVIVIAAAPIGAALGGVLGKVVGLRATVGIAAVGTVAATLVMLRSPLWSTAHVDVPEEAPAGAASPRRGGVNSSSWWAALRYG